MDSGTALDDQGAPDNTATIGLLQAYHRGTDILGDASPGSIRIAQLHNTQQWEQEDQAQREVSEEL